MFSLIYLVAVFEFSIVLGWFSDLPMIFYVLQSTFWVVSYKRSCLIFVNMESENFIGLPASGDSVIENVGHESDVQYEVKENGEDLGQEGDVQCEVQANSENLRHERDVQYEVSHCILESNLEKELVEGDSDMEIEDINNLPALDSSRSANVEIKLGGNKDGDAHCILSETITVAGESNVLFAKVHENGCLPVQDSSTFKVPKKGGPCILLPHLFFLKVFSLFIFKPFPTV